jgi:predicted mannosyl-3-phosphoglycerate phosphatase (HAD superfamily)
MDNKLIIAIDFDGTLVEHAFPEIGKPINRAFEMVQKLKDYGHKVILWTCRNDTDEALNGRKVLSEAVAFCKKQGITFDAINQNINGLGFNPIPKIYADYYIDDRSFGTHVINYELIIHTLTDK